jgi:excinuclease UvrABC ATPase subunit
VARLEGELAEVRAARERERVVLQETVQRQEMEMTQRQEALRNQGATVTRLEGELAEVRAASELAVEEKDLEIQNLRGELTVQLDARMQLNREFMAFQNSNGIRQVYRLKRWLRRFRR